MIRTLRVPMLKRYVEIPEDEIRGKLDVEERLIRDVTVSTETPARRWFGNEILSHKKSAVRLDRMKKVGSVLLSHDFKMPVAKPENVRVVDGAVKSDARFGTKQAAMDAMSDVEHGVVRGVSVGYVPIKMVLEKREEGKPSTYRVTDWEMLEWSFTPVPLDPNSNTGMRSDEVPEFREGDPVYECEVEEPDTQREEPAMKECQKCGRSYEGDSHTCPKVEKIELEQMRQSVQEEERTRVLTITRLGEKHNQEELARQFVESGKPLADFREALLEKIETREVSIGEMRQVADDHRSPSIGMNPREIRRFSLLKLLRFCASKNADLGISSRAREEAAFERDCCRTQAEILGKDPQGIFLPNDVVFGPEFAAQSGQAGRFMSQAQQPGLINDARLQQFQRDSSVGSATQGADLVGTDLLGSAFIDLLRNKSIAIQWGTTMPGLKGNVAIPRLATGATASFVTEGTANEEDPTYDQVTMAPNTIIAHVDATRKLVIQSSPAVEGVIRNDLMQSLGLGIDLAAINGSGAGANPTGILNTAGIGAVTTGGTMDWADIVELWSDVAGANADIGSLGFMCNALVAAKLMTTEKAAGYPVYLMNDERRSMLTHQVGITNQVPTAANVSSLLFGNWQDLLIGLWDAADLLVDPFTMAHQAIIRIRVVHEADIAVRRAGSFSAAQDVSTL